MIHFRCKFVQLEVKGSKRLTKRGPKFGIGFIRKYVKIF